MGRAELLLFPGATSHVHTDHTRCLGLHFAVSERVKRNPDSWVSKMTWNDSFRTRTSVVSSSSCLLSVFNHRRRTKNKDEYFYSFKNVGLKLVHSMFVFPQWNSSNFSFVNYIQMTKGVTKWVWVQPFISFLTEQMVELMRTTGHQSFNKNPLIWKLGF